MKITITAAMTVADVAALIEGAEPTEAIEFVRGRKAKTKNPCWCGCGGLTGGKFVPGHDSKFHGLAKKVARGQEAMPAEFVHAEAEADFMKWHDHDLANPPQRIAKPAAPAPTVAEADAAAEVVSVEPLAEGAELDELMAAVTMGG